MFTKTFYFDFIPTNAQGEAYKNTNTANKPTKTLIEIRDNNPPLPFDPLNPWAIKKVLKPSEAGAGKIFLLATETFNHIFRYWTMETANNVVKGSKQNVVLWDLTDENNPTSYINADMFLVAGPDCEYFVLECMDLIRDRRLIAGDEIGLFWETKSASFQFKVLNGGILS